MEEKKVYPLNTGGAEATYDIEGNIETVTKLEGEVTYRTGFTTNEAFRGALKEQGQDVPYFATPNTMRKAFESILEKDEDSLTYGKTVNGVVADAIDDDYSIGAHTPAIDPDDSTGDNSNIDDGAEVE